MGTSAPAQHGSMGDSLPDSSLLALQVFALFAGLTGCLHPSLGHQWGWNSRYHCCSLLQASGHTTQY